MVNAREDEVIPLSPGDITFHPLIASFHPHLRGEINTTLPSSASHPSRQVGDCYLHLALTIPDALFIDRDEIGDIFPYDWTLYPSHIDIERPVSESGPLSSLNLVINDSENTTVDVPLHARYLAPNEGGQETIRVFGGGRSGSVKGGWVCGQASHHADLPLVPVQPLEITLPTGRPSHQSLVELGTTAAVWLCFGYLAFRVWFAARPNPRSTKTKTS